MNRESGCIGELVKIYCMQYSRKFQLMMIKTNKSWLIISHHHTDENWQRCLVSAFGFELELWTIPLFLYHLHPMPYAYYSWHNWLHEDWMTNSTTSHMDTKTEWLPKLLSELKTYKRITFIYKFRASYKLFHGVMFSNLQWLKASIDDWQCYIINGWWDY